MKRNIFALALALTLLISTVHTETLFDGLASPWCPANGQTTFDSTDQTSANFDFDFSSTIYTDLKESTLLFVNSVAGSAFTFKSYRNNGTMVIETQCAGTGSYHFHALINEFLFLTNNGGKYYVCKYDVNGDSKPIELQSSGIFTTITDWDPYMVSGDIIYVLAGSTSNSKVVTYTWAAPTATPPTPISADKSRPLTNKPLATAAGSEQFLYDKNRTEFIRVNTAGSGWETDSVLTKAVITGFQVQVYPLRETRIVIALTQADKLRGGVYTAFEKTATQQLATRDSTEEIQDFSDHLHNFVRLHDDSLFWLTLGTSETSFTFIASEVLFTELDLANRGLSLASIFNVGLSQNKASILYDSGKLDILRHEGNGVVKLLFSKNIAGSPVISPSQTKQYKITLTCVCQAIKRFVCFSHTLNCVIVNKAGANCANGGDTYTSW